MVEFLSIDLTIFCLVYTFSESLDFLDAWNTEDLHEEGNESLLLSSVEVILKIQIGLQMAVEAAVATEYHPWGHFLFLSLYMVMTLSSLFSVEKSNLPACVPSPKLCLPWPSYCD